MEHFLNYCATCPDAKIRYNASGMILQIHSDGSYLSCPKARSRVGGHHFLSNIETPPVNNGAIHTVCKIMTNIMASAAEVEIASIFVNLKEACPTRTCLIEMGHPQPSTPVCVDNTTAVSLVQRTLKQKRSKAMDMRFYWIQD